MVTRPGFPYLFAVLFACEVEGRRSFSFLQGHPPSLRFGHPDVTTNDTALPRDAPGLAGTQGSYTLRKRHQGTLSGALRSEARKSGAPERVGSPAGAKEGYSVPTHPLLVGTRTITVFPRGTVHPPLSQATQLFQAETEELSLVARLLPGLAPTDLNIQRNTQGGGTAHLLDEHAFGGFTLTGGDFEDDFVVHLQ